MLKIVTYEAPAAETLWLSNESNFLATGEDMNPKPMGVRARGREEDEFDF